MKRSRQTTWMSDAVSQRLRSYLLLGVCLGSGCVWRGNVDVLEARLREQEGLTHAYEEQVSQLQKELSTAQREIALLRQRPIENEHANVSFEVQRSLVEVMGIKFNSLLTAGQDLDSQPGDERIHAVLYPHDSDGEIVKIAGELSLEAMDPSLPEGQRSLGKWSVPISESKKYWHAGFISSGFLIDSPWDSPPRGQTIILHARFTTPDQRTFQATHTLKVNPIPPLEPWNREPLAGDEHSAGVGSDLNATPSGRLPRGSFDTPASSGNPILTSDRWAADEIPVAR